MRASEHVLPRSTRERIRLLSCETNVVRRNHAFSAEPSSFGVYLGALNTPLTKEEAKVLSQWDAVVLDYSAPGVLEAVNNQDARLGSRIIARLDLRRVSHFASVNEDSSLETVNIIFEIIQQKLRRPNQRRYFTGVLVSEWREHISTPLLNGLAKLFSAHGLDVYIEVSSPNFLDGIEGLDLSVLAGSVVRNATLLMNGDRADFFEVDKLKSMIKAFASKACQRPPLILVWDVIEDNVNLSHAVVKRAHKWCRHQGVVFYLTRQRALTNVADIMFYGEPLASFQWLKDQRVMNVHEQFRTAEHVRYFACPNQGGPLTLCTCSSLQKLRGLSTICYRCKMCFRFSVIPWRACGARNQTTTIHPVYLLSHLKSQRATKACPHYLLRPF